MKYNSKIRLKKVKTLDEYKEDTQSENYAAFIFNTSIPLTKSYENFTGNLIPKLNARYSPTKSENLSDLDRKINITNMFSSNRLGLNDSIEGGQSLTIGFDYNLKTLTK